MENLIEVTNKKLAELNKAINNYSESETIVKDKLAEKRHIVFFVGRLLNCSSVEQLPKFGIKGI